MAIDDVKQAGSGVGFQVGSKIGKYEVRERLGIGGQAIVYKCYDPLLDRFVAVKQISAHLAEDPRFMERFRKEAQILARLGSEQPAIVTIYELIENEFGLFIVMEYVSGHTLETVLKDNPGPIEPKAALQVLWRLAAALHVVHQAGIIHRDIKPSNIIIAEGLRAKITDFGVAASASGQTSMLLGTTKYMAPELFSGSVMDGRADMYSLGFIAYEMLVGRAKFNEIFADVVRDHHSESLRWMKWHGSEQVTAPLAHEVNRSVPASLGNIVAKMMAKNPDQRFANMEALGRAIKQAFSPKGKAAAAAGAGLVGGPVRSVRGAAAVAEKPVLSEGDEGDELDVAPEDNPTAPIPKKRLSKRAKYVLLGSIVTIAVAAMTTMMILRFIEEGDIQKNAQAAWRDAQARYRKGEFAEAKTRCENLIRRFSDKIEAKKAQPLVHLCQVHLDIRDQKWQEALQEKQELDKLLKEYMRDPGLSDMAKQIREKEADPLAVTINDAWRFSTEFAKVKEMIQDGQLTAAREKLEDVARLMTLTAEQVQMLAETRTQIQRIEVSTRLREASQRALKALADKDYVNAQVGLRNAMALLSSDEVRVMDPQEVAQIRAALEQGMEKMKNLVDYEAILVKIGNARQAGKKTEEIAALKEALAMRPGNKEFEARIVELETELAYLQILDALNQGDEPTAMKLLKPFIAKYPSHPKAKSLLESLENKATREALIREADTLYDSKEWAQSLEKYQEGAKIRTDPRISQRIEDCQFNLELEAADALRDAKRWDEALKAYAEVMRKFAAKAGVVEPRVAKIRDRQDYEGGVKAVQDLISQGLYSKARSSLDKLQQRFGSDATRQTELNQLKNRSFFLEYMWLGKRALEMNELDVATGHLNNAKGKAQSEAEIQEVNELILRVRQRKFERESRTP